MDTRTLKNIYKKINHKTKLQSHKLKLSAIDDIREYRQILDENINVLSELEMEVKMLGDDFSQKWNEMVDLAVDFAEKYEEYDAVSSSASNLSSEAEQVNENYAILADELGIDANDNQDYAMLDQQIDTLNELTESNTVLAYSYIYEDASKFQR